jgi:hypothetical protein
MISARFNLRLSFTFENRKRVATKAEKEDLLHRLLRYGKNSREHDSCMAAAIDAGREIAPVPGKSAGNGPPVKTGISAMCATRRKA